MANLSWSPLPQNALGCAYAWNEGDVINPMPLKGPLGIGAIIPGIGLSLSPVEEITERIGGWRLFARRGSAPTSPSDG